MSGELSRNTCGAFPRRQVVDGADVVKTTARDVVARRRVRAGHDPRGSQRDGVDLVRCVSVPDDELSVLRSGNEMSAVGRPVHGVDLGKMALKCTLGLHGKARQGLDAVAGDIADCMRLLASQHRGGRCSAVRCSAVQCGAVRCSGPWRCTCTCTCTCTGTCTAPARERRTGCVSELVLLPFYPVLQGLGVAPCDLNFLLDGLLVHVGHATLELPGGEGGVSRRARERMRRGRANPGGLAGSAAVGTG